MNESASVGVSWDPVLGRCSLRGLLFDDDSHEYQGWPRGRTLAGENNHSDGGYVTTHINAKDIPCA